MDATKIYKLVKKKWTQFNFNEKIMLKNKAQFNASIESKDNFDDDVFLDIITYDTGVAHVFFVFDELKPTLDAFCAINDFNTNSSWYKAYLDGNGEQIFLKLHFVSLSGKNEAEVAENISFAILNLISEETLEYLKPLTQMTE